MRKVWLSGLAVVLGIGVAHAGDEGYRWIPDHTGRMDCRRPLRDASGNALLDRQGNPVFKNGHNPNFFGECGDQVNVDLRGRTLQGNFDGARFVNSTLDDVEIRLAHSSFVGAEFVLSTMAGCRVTGTPTKERPFGNAIFDRVDWRGAKLSGLTYGGDNQGHLAFAKLEKILFDKRTELPHGMDPNNFSITTPLIDVDDRLSFGPVAKSGQVFGWSGMPYLVNQRGWRILAGEFREAETIHGFRPRLIEVRRTDTRHFRVFGGGVTHKVTINVQDSFGNVVATESAELFRPKNEPLEFDWELSDTCLAAFVAVSLPHP